MLIEIFQFLTPPAPLIENFLKPSLMKLTTNPHLIQQNILTVTIYQSWAVVTWAWDNNSLQFWNFSASQRMKMMEMLKKERLQTSQEKIFQWNSEKLTRKLNPHQVNFHYSSTLWKDHILSENKMLDPCLHV